MEIMTNHQTQLSFTIRVLIGIAALVFLDIVVINGFAENVVKQDTWGLGSTCHPL